MTSTRSVDPRGQLGSRQLEPDLHRGVDVAGVGQTRP